MTAPWQHSYTPTLPQHVRTAVLVLGDQLTTQTTIFDQLDPETDVLVMIEAEEQSRKPWSHKARIALFLSAMRHFAVKLLTNGWPLVYTPLDAPSHAGSLISEFTAVATRLQPKQLLATQPGCYAIKAQLESATADLGMQLQWIQDSTFLCTTEAFDTWADAHKSLRNES